MSQARVKICGIRDLETALAAADLGAAYIGFVSFEKSPRHLPISEAAQIASQLGPKICKTALVVDPSDDALDAYLNEVPIDMIQLHGHETPERIEAIKTRYGLPIMKAVGIADESDLAQLYDYIGVADQILIDAKPPKGADLPGGNGLRFDWRLLQNRRWSAPWMLAGGLTPENASEAMMLTGAQQLDVSSGVESAPGVKDIVKIRAFIENAVL